MKFAYHGPMSPFFGYGVDGLGIVATVERMGMEVTPVPTTFQPPVPPTVALTLTRGINPPYRTYLACHNPGDIRYAPELGDTADASVYWTMWEAPELGPEVRENQERFREVISKFDVVLGYDDTTMEALEPYVGGTRLVKLQGGYDSERWQYGVLPENVPPRDWNADIFRFGMVGSLSPRKNPWASIKAFKLLKEKYGDKFQAELHLKSTDDAMHKAMEEWLPGLRIYNEKWGYAQLRAFYESLHCYLAPSRGEGKNLPPMEALTTGCPVILTWVGGHREWFLEDFGWVVPGVPKKYQLGMGIEADVEALAELMWKAYENRPWCREKGWVGSRTVPAMRDWEVVMKKFFATVDG